MQTLHVKSIPGASGDNGIIYLPRLWKPNGTMPAVILCGGTNEVWTLGFNETHVLPVARALTNAGYAVGWSDFGINQYGNVNAQNRIAALRTYMQSSVVGAKSGKIAIAGFSMGGLNALDYAGNNPSHVMSVMGWCPLVDMQFAEASSTIKPYLDAAYPGGWSQSANGATTNPMTMAAAGNYNGISIQFRYASDDTVIPFSTLQNFAATAAGVSVVNVGALGHSWNTVLAAPSITASIDQISAANT